MINAVQDTAAILHLFRKSPPAIQWFNNRQCYAVVHQIRANDRSIYDK